MKNRYRWICYPTSDDAHAYIIKENLPKDIYLVVNITEQDLPKYPQLSKPGFYVYSKFTRKFLYWRLPNEDETLDTS